jgi:cytochrome d ubiquinol oxidase subunit I
MVGMGLAMVALGIWGAALWATSGLMARRFIIARSCSPRPPASSPCSPDGSPPKSAASPMSSMACSGQLMRSRPSKPAPVATSLLFFMIVYAIVFSAGALYILRLMANGPASDEPPPRDTSEPPGSPLGTGVKSAAAKGRHDPCSASNSP